MSLHPFLFVTNTERTAMTRSQEILGDELDGMVIHAALTFVDGEAA